MASSPSVVIVGAGAAGALTAVHLLRTAPADEPLSIVLLDPAERCGRGVAYGTTDARHLLNVPASRLGAFADLPGHFLSWYRGKHGPTPAYSFLPRAHYGDYLASTLRTTLSVHGGSLRHHRARATAIDEAGGGVVVATDDGAELPAEAVVLATGLPAVGADWAPPPLRASHHFVADPWSADAIDRVVDDPSGGDVLLVGTGLTAIDVALTLASSGRRLHAVSRSGRFPAPHGERPVTPAIPDVTDWGRALAGIRERAQAHVTASVRTYGDWRPAVDGLRHQASELWQRLSEHDRLRFLATDASRWSAVRHRVPPTSRAALDRLREEGRLSLAAAEVVDARPVREGLEVDLSDGRRLTVGWVVNCTGPRGDVRTLGDPLVDDLLRDRPGGPLATVATAGLGLRTQDGRLAPSIWTVGALRRGDLWESTAIVDIRVQAEDVARRIHDARSAARRRDRGHHEQVV
jgi:uncharacterized NAD(P)/FAD-binding protein YdhS